MTESFHIKSATGGFKGQLWRVTKPDGEREFVHALSNYEAAEACGLNFNQCRVDLLKVVEETR